MRKSVLLTLSAVYLVSANPVFQSAPIQSYPSHQQAYNVPSNFIAHQPSYIQNQPNPQNQRSNYGQQSNQPTANGNDNIEQLLLNHILTNPAVKTILDPNTKLFNQNGVEIPRHNGNVVNNYIIIPPDLLLDDSISTKNVKGNTVEERRNNNGNKEAVRKNKNGRRRQNKENTEDEPVKSPRRRQRQRSRNDKSSRQEINPKDNVVKLTDEPRITTAKDSRKDNVATVKLIVEPKGVVKHNKSESNTEKSKNPVIVDGISETDGSGNQNKNIAELLANKTQNDSVEKISVLSEGNKTIDKEVIMQNALLDISERPESNNNESVLLANSGRVEEVPNEHTSMISIQRETPQHGENVVHLPKPIRKDTSPERQTKAPNTNEKLGAKQSSIRLKINPTQRDPKEEAVIQELRQKFPNIPEDTVLNLIAYMKEKLKNEELEATQLYYPNFPITYDQMYNTQPDVIKNKGGGNRTNRRNQSRKSKDREGQNKEKCDTVVELEPIYYEDKADVSTKSLDSKLLPRSDATSFDKLQPPITVRITEGNKDKTSTTTEKPSVTKTYSVQEETITRESTETESDTPESVEGIAENTTPDLGTEDIVPTISVNSLIEDYYPDFTRDSQLLASNEGINRYQYTTDKNFELEELNRERRKFGQNRESNQKSASELKGIAKGSSYSEENQSKPSKVLPIQEVHQFMTPPTLEMPDFETKQIEKEYFKEFNDPYYDVEEIPKYEERLEKTSTYSDAKTPQYNTVQKPSRIRKRKNFDVETDFAKSRVVKYGTPENFDGIQQKKKIKDTLGGGDASQRGTDEDQIIVVAKSIVDPKDFW